LNRPVTLDVRVENEFRSRVDCSELHVALEAMRRCACGPKSVDAVEVTGARRPATVDSVQH
jgi:hypothetical protein